MNFLNFIIKPLYVIVDEITKLPIIENKVEKEKTIFEPVL